MAEGVLFNIAEEIIKTLGSLIAQEVALWWGLKDQLRKLNDTVTRIKAVIQDAEEQAQTQNHQIEDWLKKLVKALRERLDDIETDSKRFNFVALQEEGASLTTVSEQTTSSEPEVIVGREGDKVVVKTFLMNSNYEHNVSVISVVGIGGLGKTTLAQHVYNDEQVQAHFGVKIWLSVSGSLDVRKIIKGAVGRRCIEIVGLKCFESLLWRSFFHEVEKDRFGNIESCKMYDFMLDRATKVASFQSIKVERGGKQISKI
uniref:Uncharacterized protein n=1 Tax=Populus alba TaxID=43335 RepID=A0A4U5MYT6_POPAL|nr:hypothetical protein D5086_0000286410 [Populus alba]